MTITVWLAAQPMLIWDHHSCLEVIILKGESRHVQKLADLLITTKGVQHGRLVMSSPNVGLPKLA